MIDLKQDKKFLELEKIRFDIDNVDKSKLTYEENEALDVRYWEAVENIYEYAKSIKGANVVTIEPASDYAHKLLVTTSNVNEVAEYLLSLPSFIEIEVDVYSEKYNKWFDDYECYSDESIFMKEFKPIKSDKVIELLKKESERPNFDERNMTEDEYEEADELFSMNESLIISQLSPSELISYCMGLCYLNNDFYIQEGFRLARDDRDYYTDVRFKHTSKYNEFSELEKLNYFDRRTRVIKKIYNDKSVRNGYLLKITEELKNQEK